MNLSKWCVALGVCFLSACSATERAIGPEGVEPRNELVAIDCQLTPAQCSIIQGGIAYLKSHLNPMCRAMGANADDRYWAPAGTGDGFRGEPAHPTLSMSVFTTAVGGYTPADGYTNVYANYWSSQFTDPGAAGGLIAHEEVHHLGFAEDAAESMQRQCLNPQA